MELGCRLSDAMGSLAAAVAEKQQELRAREAAVAAGEHEIGLKFCHEVSQAAARENSLTVRKAALDYQAEVLQRRAEELAAREKVVQASFRDLAWNKEQSDTGQPQKYLSWLQDVQRQTSTTRFASELQVRNDVWCVACKGRVNYGYYHYCCLCDSGGCDCCLEPRQELWWCPGCAQEYDPLSG